MPGDTKTHIARMSKKAKGKPGSLDDLTHTLWKAIKRLDDHLEQLSDSDGKTDTSELCKLTHCLSQSASVYARVVEVGELENRLEALEQAQLVRAA
jgi:hypothetical protein